MSAERKDGGDGQVISLPSREAPQLSRELSVAQAAEVLYGTVNGVWKLAISGSGEPKCPEHYTIVSHHPHGDLRWSQNSLGAFAIQRTEHLNWSDLRRKMKSGNLHFVNVCVRDAILENQKMFPLELFRMKCTGEDYEKPLDEFRVFFPGTRFRDSGGFEVLAGIQWSVEKGAWAPVMRRLKQSWKNELIFVHQDAEPHVTGISHLFPGFISIALLAALVWSVISG